MRRLNLFWSRCASSSHVRSQLFFDVANISIFSQVNAFHCFFDKNSNPGEDFIRTQIISKKLNPKLLEAEDFQDKKLVFYGYMIQYWISEENYFEVAKSYQHMLNTEKVKADEAQWKPILTSFVVYLCMAKYDKDQDALLAKVKVDEEKRLEKIPFVHSLINSVLEKELTPWPLPQQAELLKLDIFSTTPPSIGEKRFKTFQKAVVQSNIRVCAGYYTRITIKRLSTLLHLTEDEVEAELSELVWNKTCVLKIDRPAGIVKFGKREDTKDRLNKFEKHIHLTRINHILTFCYGFD
jgi:26S proteasome regulatory subunit N5